jgi:aspartyl-tRNA(Asn)/glutamyl-tRNA(Gln) amidotransferase subunit C
MTIDDVNKLATLSRIDMSDAEKQEFLANMESILKYVDTIKGATVDGVKPEVGEVRNVMREDTDPHESGIYTDKITAQFPARDGDYLKVKQIL